MSDAIMKIILFALSISLVSFAYAGITMKGRWSAECNGVFISEHNRYDKAFEAILEIEEDCVIYPPLRWEVKRSKTTNEESNIRVLTLSWGIPNKREDESNLPLSEIDGYKIYNLTTNEAYLVEDESQTKYSLEIELGEYDFAISTVTIDGLEGAKSDSIKVVVL